MAFAVAISTYVWRSASVICSVMNHVPYVVGIVNAVAQVFNILFSPFNISMGKNKPKPHKRDKSDCALMQFHSCICSEKNVS